MKTDRLWKAVRQRQIIFARVLRKRCDGRHLNKDSSCAHFYFFFKTFLDFGKGCGYVVSREAIARVLALFPYFPILDIEDAFLTGVLGRGAGLQYFSVAHSNYFAEFFHHITDWCNFLQDKLITGTGVGTHIKRLNLWASYIANDWQCHNQDLSDSPSCWIEFPRVAE
ncbi:hexosyltransferase [Plakobranchus ocellatus]|uniref:Hexosyltransferase n=1 Tax=Plakobranchus ocellatus TaxID=259542 RepID=A0AAV3ZLS2_9GAST|nr:hexosyltransferase [Plakobranchus ocellatus]